MSEEFLATEASAELSATDLAILDFEKSWLMRTRSKDAEIREHFSISPTSYYQQLNALLDNPAALQHDPLLIKRLRRLRNTRRQERSAQRLQVLINA